MRIALVALLAIMTVLISPPSLSQIGGTSIQGTLLMLDGTTPHVAVPVQAIREEKVSSSTLSDENGKYRFSDLKPGSYRVRCYVPGEYVYYSEGKDRTTLDIEHGKSLKNIDFRLPALKKGTWKSYTYLDGLSSNWVYNIYCDPDKIMWFGTISGFSRYDGLEFVSTATRYGLPFDIIDATHRDTDGMIWLGTEGGVYQYDGKNFVNFTTENGLTGNGISTIYRAPDGMMWFGTFGDGVSRCDGRDYRNFTNEDGLTDNRVYSIHSGTDGVTWFGTSGGVSRWKGI